MGFSAPKIPYLPHPRPNPPLEGEGTFLLSIRERIKVRVGKFSYFFVSLWLMRVCSYLNIACGGDYGRTLDAD